MSLQSSYNCENYAEKIQEAADFIKSRIGDIMCRICIVLGSGIGQFGKEFDDPIIIPYDDIPHMIKTTVVGHSGNIVIGHFDDPNQHFLCFAGRIHSYEGVHLFEVAFLAQLAKALGSEIFIATNAAGGAIHGMIPGDGMIIRDHVNFIKRNPLLEICASEKLCKSTSNNKVYSDRIALIAKQIAKQVPGFGLQEGTYACCCGPSYETPTEVQGGVHLGIGAFGMSTVPECTVAHSLGMEVFALSLCTNLASGIIAGELSHEEVTQVAAESGPRLMKFMRLLVTHLSSEAAVAPTLEPSILETRNSFSTFKRTSERLTPEKIAESKAWLSEKVKTNVIESAALLPVQYHESFLDALTDTITLDASEIPHYPTLAHGQTKIVVGKNSNGTWVLAIIPTSESGLSPSYATWFVDLLSAFHTSLLYFCALASSKNESEYDVIVELVDGADVTTIHSFPTSASTLPQMSTDIQLFSSSHKEEVKKKGEYVQYPGPSYPTPAESRIVHTSCPDALVGITSLQLVYAARAVGINVVGAAAVVHKNPSFSLTANYKSTIQTLSTLAANTILALKPQVKETSNEAIVKTTLPETQIDYEPFECIQGKQEELQSVIDILRTHNFIHGIVVYDELFATLSSRLSDISEIDVGAHAFATLYKARYNDTNIVVVRQEKYYNQGYPMYQLVSAVRAIVGAGVCKLAFFSSVCSVSPCVPVNSVITVKDHTNISCRNPLTGHQVSGWGARFPDMSSCWNPISAHLKTQVQEVVVGGVIGPIFYSPIEGKLSTGHLAEVVSTGMVFEAITAHHQNPEVETIGLCPVTSSMATLAKPKLEEALETFTAALDELLPVFTDCRLLRSLTHTSQTKEIENILSS